MPTLALLLAVLIAPFVASTAKADPIRPQCWICLEHLASELPAVNPQEDPSYEQGLTPGSVLPALTSCSLDDGQLPVLQKIIKVFSDASVGNDGAAYVREHLDRLPEVKPADRAKLVDGARQDLQTTLQYLIDHNCRLLLQEHFDEGASRDWIIRMIKLGQGSENHE